MATSNTGQLPSNLFGEIGTNGVTVTNGTSAADDDFGEFCEAPSQKVPSKIPDSLDAFEEFESAKVPEKKQNKPSLFDGAKDLIDLDNLMTSNTDQMKGGNTGGQAMTLHQALYGGKPTGTTGLY